MGVIKRDGFKLGLSGISGLGNSTVNSSGCNCDSRDIGFTIDIDTELLKVWDGRFRVAVWKTRSKSHLKNKENTIQYYYSFDIYNSNQKNSIPKRATIYLIDKETKDLISSLSSNEEIYQIICSRGEKQPPFGSQLPKVKKQKKQPFTFIYKSLDDITDFF